MVNETRVNGERSPPHDGAALPYTHDLDSGEQSETNGVESPAIPLHTTAFPATGTHLADAEAYKAAGNKFFKAGDYAAAIAQYGQAIELDPQSSTYLSNRAAAYIGMNHFAEALLDARQADALEPNNSKILHRLARIYTALGKPSEAIEIYARIHPPSTAKDSLPAYTMRGHIEQAEIRLREDSTGSMALHALDQAERGLGFGVEKPRKWNLLRAEAYLKMGNTNALGDAQNVVMSLLRSNNQDPDALVLRGRILYAQGENEKAIQHFRQALNCDPDFKEAVKHLRMVQRLERTKGEGNTAFKSGRYDDAVRFYGEALEIDPANKGTNSKILQNRALASIKVETLAQDQVHALTPYTVEGFRLCYQ